MALKVHSEFSKFFEARPFSNGLNKTNIVEDVLQLRSFIDSYINSLMKKIPDQDNIRVTNHQVLVDAGQSLEVHWYYDPRSDARSTIVYAHGGGMICGSVDIYDRLIRYYVAKTGVPFLAVNYRLAPEQVKQPLAEDVVTAIRWLVEKSEEMSADPTRIAVMGDSGGGGVAAAAAIICRDRKLDLAAQILIYPMLDDRTVKPDPLIEPLTTWTYQNNIIAWNAVLGDSRGTENVSPERAPGRLKEFHGLPQTYLEIGDLDIFRDESIRYASGLLAAGVHCELHVHAGVPHGIEMMDFESQFTQRVLAERIRVVTTL